MPKFAANISTMYGEFEFLDRIDAARADGFEAIESQGIGQHPLSELVERALDANLSWVLFNAPAGDAGQGERGFAALPERRDAFRASIDEALETARQLACPSIHVLSGRVSNAGVGERARMRETLLENMSWASEAARGLPLTFLLEPINGRDIPGYFLNHQADAHAICAELGVSNVKVQMDFYHCQIVEGDLATRWKTHHAGVGHIQVAGVPERHEPDCGEVNFPYLFGLIDELGYQGWVGCEYFPRTTTRAGLGWLYGFLGKSERAGLTDAIL